MVLHSQIKGSGRAFVLLHGLFGSGDNLSSLAARMSGLEVHLPDLRCHGLSPRSAKFSLRDLADDVAEYVAASGLDSPVVGGHSLGAKVAMELALSHPELVGGLVCLDASPLTGCPRYSNELKALEELDLSAISGRTQARERLGALIPDPLILAFLLKSLVPDVSLVGGWRWLFDPVAIRASFGEIWKPVTSGLTYAGPTLFLTAGNSDFFPASAVDPTLALFPQAVFAAVEGAGHWLHADKPLEVLSTLNSWLTDTGLMEIPEWT